MVIPNAALILFLSYFMWNKNIKEIILWDQDHKFL